MASKKKKVSNCFQKQHEAHHKNLYLKKVIEIAKAVSLNDAYKLLSDDLLDTIYQIRFRTIRVVTESNLNYPAKELQEIKESIIAYAKDQEFVIEGNENKIGLYDFLGPGISLWHHLSYIKDKKADKYPEIVNAFNDFVETTDFIRDAFNAVYTLTNYIAWERSAFDKKLISIHLGVKAHETDSQCFYVEAKIKEYNPQVIHVTIEGNTRPAFRIGIANYGNEVAWIDLPATTLRLGHLGPETKIPVYIQHHALNRLNERLDCVSKSMQLINLIFSIDHAKYIQYKGKKLIEYNYFDNKIGYLMIELMNGVAVIKTFLLLTHNCTPEGDNLQNIIGFEKPDISYLNFDKLSTFVLSDLRENQPLYELFTRAGCNPLLEVKRHDSDKEYLVINESFIGSYFSKYQEYSKNFELSEFELEPTR